MGQWLRSVDDGWLMYGSQHRVDWTVNAFLGCLRCEEWREGTWGVFLRGGII
ncbi:MAG: hypothetical protein ACTHJ4_03190 [Candidatus Nucleicultricaceae bacterium]